MAATPHADRQPNRLSRESSPYLQQHAYNPVDWFPWGDEAFTKARVEDKPVFLSVGYSACHWCHVMERESFENEEIARLLNEHFVSIKVDREERPDVDQIYMSAVQLITRRGGWPMSVFLTPDGYPFYGGTYWPPASRMGMPGFRDILNKLHDYWSQRRDEITSSAEQLADAIQRMTAPVFEQAELNEEMLQQATRSLIAAADRVHGGFGGAPKFPHPMDIRVLLRGWKRFHDDEALEVALLTLDKMSRGGIYDHLGGGFHRYSTDAYWLAPHFEKMLYDNALLVPAYLEAFQITGNVEYARVVRETLDYVLREMTSPEGGFYSTQDADSEGHEGKFFVWTDREIAELLGPDDVKIFSYCYDVAPSGNWEGQTILNRPKSLEEAATFLGISEKLLDTRLADCRRRLFEARGHRIAPGRDEKILVAWNGLMISAFSQAAVILSEVRYATAAERAADFLLKHVLDERGRLLHSFKDGRARFQAYLDDYACLIDGLIDLFQATSNEAFLKRGLALADDVIARFTDQEYGGFFYTASDHEQLIARTKDLQDNATPSGNGTMACALLKLARLTGRRDLEDQAIRTLDALGGMLVEHPAAGGQSLLALELLLGPSMEIVVVNAGDGIGSQVWKAVWGRFLPNKVAFQWRPGVEMQLLGSLLEGKTDATASKLYLCERGRCGLPASTVTEAQSQLALR